MMRSMTAVALLALLLAAGTGCASAQNPELVEAGRRAFMNQGCYGCHTVGKVGTPIAPDLSRVGAKYRPEYLARWLRDPAYLRPSAHMPPLELSEEEIRVLAAFLSAQQ
jgi:mono/diheme cytochrome c family protein